MDSRTEITGEKLDELLASLQPIISEATELSDGITDDCCYAIERHPQIGLAEFDVGDLRRIKAAHDSLVAARASSPARSAEGMLTVKLEKLPVAFEVYDTENGVYLTRSEEAAIASGHEYAGLYRREGSGANMAAEWATENWKLNCQYLLDLFDNWGFISSSLGEEDEGEIERIRAELLIGERNAAG
jgi:hypothetical protein